MAQATYDLGDGQGVIITVTGRKAKAVTDFTNAAQFHFELAEPLPEASDHPAASPDTFPHDIQDDPATDSLLIEFQLTPTTLDKHPIGTLIGVIDPTVPYKMFHNFDMKYRSKTVKSTVKVSAWVSDGGVEVRVYRDCIRATAAPLGTPYRAASTSMSDTETGTVDLVVYGSGSSSNTYELRGEWPYDYDDYVKNNSRAYVC